MVKVPPIKTSAPSHLHSICIILYIPRTSPVAACGDHYASTTAGGRTAEQQAKDPLCVVLFCWPLKGEHLAVRDYASTIVVKLHSVELVY